jgi:hypothetical protein
MPLYYAHIELRYFRHDAATLNIAIDAAATLAPFSGRILLMPLRFRQRCH